jgi:hypothetical protein
VQVVDMQRRHPYFARPFWRGVVQVVAQRLMHPLEGATLTVAEREVWLHLRSRRGCASELLEDAFAPLEEEYVGMMVGQLQGVHDALAASCGAPGEAVTRLMLVRDAGGAAPGQHTWQAVEIAVWCFTAVSADICNLLEEADLPDGQPAEMIIALLCLVAGPVELDAMPTELAVTVCGWLGSLASWWHQADMGGSLRCADLFHRSSPARTTAGGDLDAAITLVPTADLFQSTVSQLVRALPAVRCCLSGFTPPSPFHPNARSVAALFALLARESGVLSRRTSSLPDPVSSPSSDGVALDDDEAGDGEARDPVFQLGVGGVEGEESPLGALWLPVAAAQALHSICNRCASALSVAGTLPHLVQAVLTCDALQLPVSVVARLEAGVLSVAARHGDGATVTAALQPLLHPLVQRLQGTLTPDTAAAAVSSSSAERAGFQISVLRDTVYLVTAFRHRDLDAGGVTGMSELRLADLERPDAEARIAAATTSPLQFVVDAVWPAIVAAMPVVHADEVTVSALLALLQHCTRAAQRTALSCLPDLTTMALQLYEAHMYPQALSTCIAAVDALPASGGGGILGQYLDAPLLAPEAVAFLTQLMAGASRTTHAAAVAGKLMDAPEAAQEYLQLADRLLSVAPAAVITPDALSVALPLAAMSLSLYDRVIGRAASELVRCILTRGDLRSPPWRPVVDDAMVACGASCRQRRRRIGRGGGRRVGRTCGS